MLKVEASTKHMETAIFKGLNLGTSVQRGTSLLKVKSLPEEEVAKIWRKKRKFSNIDFQKLLNHFRLSDSLASIQANAEQFTCIRRTFCHAVFQARDLKLCKIMSK